MSEGLPVAVDVDNPRPLPIEYTHDGFAARFRVGTSIEERQHTIEFLLAFDQRNPFLIGDLVNQTQEELGETYAQIAPDTPYAARALANYCWVASRIPPENRVRGIGISLYQVIAGFKNPVEQRVWIERVLEEGMNRKELREAKQREEEEHAGVASLPTTDGKEPVTMVECPCCKTIVPETAIHGEEN
jgi:hypothetical protein